jgi:uncharacterized protein YyaL (SSP411 family)
MHTNALVHEKSPYLLQHAHNPVDWMPWGEAAFAKARAEDKPIFLSIGYSTCHWCHVMERESFENEQIAQFLNQHFVPVKLDREERPDVDRVYMTFVQATTGGGGWPLSVWLTPDLKPFFGGTYFPPESRWGRPGFLQVLEQIATAWQARKEKILEAGARIQEEIGSMISLKSGGALPSDAAAEEGFQQFRRLFDPRFGGFGGAPKFPRPSVLQFLLRHHRLTGSKEALQMVEVTLDAMRCGGMHDHLGGGFHRYSVDERWFVPHFEKMLYDQAQLISAYTEAFQAAGASKFADTARMTAEYVLRDMTHAEGGFYSAEDADSEDPARPGHQGEGAFYVWAWRELEDALGKDAAHGFAEVYGCLPGGNVHQDPHGEFEGKNILWLQQPAMASDPAIETARRRLFDVRAQRPRPHLDDKILASWNGLMISALARAGAALAEERYIEAGRRAFAFLQSAMMTPEGRLFRRWRDGEAAFPGTLDDYAAVILAALDLHQACFDPNLLETAARLAQVMLEEFADPDGGFYTSSAAAQDLLFRMKEDYDGAEPSGNSLAVEALVRTARLTGDAALLEPARRALEAFAERLESQPSALPRMLCAWMLFASPEERIVFRGAAEELVQEAWRHFLPFTALIREKGGEPSAEVCSGLTCHAPVRSVEDLRRLLH